MWIPWDLGSTFFPHSFFIAMKILFFAKCTLGPGWSVFPDRRAFCSQVSGGALVGLLCLGAGARSEGPSEGLHGAAPKLRNDNRAEKSRDSLLSVALYTLQHTGRKDCIFFYSTSHSLQYLELTKDDPFGNSSFANARMFISLSLLNINIAESI